MRRLPEAGDWQGRIDTGETADATRWHQHVRCAADASAAPQDAVALIGFACDAGVRRNQGRPGAAQGPAVIRAALGPLAWHLDADVLDFGDVVCEGDELEAAQGKLGDVVAALLTRGLHPVVMGGGHEVAWASWQGIARWAATKTIAPRIGILNFDAHFDLRQAHRANSGTPFRQIAEDCARRGWPFDYLCLGVAETANTAALFARAEALGVRWRSDSQMAPWRLGETEAVVDAFLAGVDGVHLTVDLDALPAATAPGVSAPAALGVELAVVEHLIERVAATGKLLLGEIAEFNPVFDIDKRTARVAARLCVQLSRALGRPAAKP